MIHSVCFLVLSSLALSISLPLGAGETNAAEPAKADADAYKNEGNLPPRIEKLTPEQEAAILKDVTVPEGFDVTVFAAPPAANYPVFIAAAPNGDLYVSSDGNGSLGRNPHRGRILRLRDKDGDGRADEVTEFVKDLDAPRGLVWDHDRLYVVHPPDLSVFIDKDGDGAAEERKELVKGIAFGYDQRPADHTTNGLSLGIDGWLYIAGGDFGFMDAVGTDGKHLQHRGGGVLRVRPDGSGLEVYSEGTRNILEVAISPTMDIFARDNTNDGGGWDIRFHHFTGGEEHGYPRLFKNFNDECIQPLGIYGGGSGCGAVYIDEPGFGEWNNAPFTADWGTGALWHHSVIPKGATFEETEKPRPFIKMTRPTDADVDAMSRVYCASWKGATFNWEGPDVGYIVCVRPKGFKPEPLPDFAKASDPELVKLLKSTSYRRRLAAKTVLARRLQDRISNNDEATFNTLAKAVASIYSNQTLPVQMRLAAEWTLLETGLRMTYPGDERDAFSFNLDFVSPPNTDPHQVQLERASVRKMVDTPPDQRVGPVSPPLPKAEYLAADTLLNAWKSPKVMVEVLRGAALHHKAAGPGSGIFSEAFRSDDPVVQHCAVRALSAHGGWEFGFAALDSPQATPQVKSLSLRALATMHTPEAVDGIISHLQTITDTATRKGLLSALCRLHFHEGEWKGDSWGTRPDTRGPYYQPEAWSETPKIAAALKDALNKATPEEAAFLISELNRNRIQFNEALDRILMLAAKDAKLVPDAVGQLASADTIPASAVPLLIQAANLTSASPQVLAQAITALAKTDSAEGCRASLTALVTLGKAQGSGKEQEAGRAAFLTSPKLENHHQLLEAEAERIGTPTALWADMALLNLSSRTSSSPESRVLSGKALDAGWQNPQRRAQILKAVAQVKHHVYADKVLAALDDPDKSVAAAAKHAAEAMKLKKREKSNEPLIKDMKPEDVIAQVVKTHGDVDLGEQLFTRQTCVACHTTSADQPPKGPYLGNIAQTYKRPELAQNILEPSKTVAQGFATNMFFLRDGSGNMGFVTDESGDKVTMRNAIAQEFTYKKSDIAKREAIPGSIMPLGLVQNLTIEEFASLLDYLESLAKK